MKATYMAGIATVCVIAIWALVGLSPAKSKGAITMTIHSTAFANNGAIPDQFGCRGIDVSPPLEISQVPASATRLALIVSDPDAPGGVFYHWLVWNIPASVSSLEQGWQPPTGAITGTNDFGTRKWQGPCPPSGTHHYHFTVYALNRTVDLPPTSSARDVVKAVRAASLGQADLVGTYSK